MIVPQATMPSFFAIAISLPFTPIVTTSSRFVLVVRSPPTDSHVWPWFDERKTRLEPANSTAELCGERMNGVSQFQRYGCSPGGATGRIDTVSPVTLTARNQFPSFRCPYAGP